MFPPPHLAKKKGLFICVCFFLCLCPLLSLLLLEKNLCFPPKKAISVYFFCISLCFSLALFHFLLFLCLSLLFFLASFRSVFVISVSGFCFFFLFCLVSSFKLFFGFCCSACCLALFWIIIFHLCLLCIFCLPFVLVLCFACFGFLYCIWSFGKPIKNIFKKNGNWKNSKKWNMRRKKKNGHFEQEQLAQLCSQIVSFLFFVFL